MTPTITRILFATDLSPNSAYAFRHAVSMAHATGAKLHLLHVTEPLSEDARITMQIFIQDKSAREEALKTKTQYLKAELEERQKRFWESLPEADQALKSQVEFIKVVEGHPAEAILRLSEQWGCDLIILGAHNHGFSQTFLGSIAKRVLRRATIPTLVVPYRKD